jgi:hypothetical protein
MFGFFRGLIPSKQPPEIARQTLRSDKDLLDALREELVRVASQLASQEKVSLDRVGVLARRINPRCPIEDVQEVSFRHFIKAGLAVNQFVFLPADSIYIVDVEDQQVRIQNATVDRETWCRHSYHAGTSLWSARMSYQRGSIDGVSGLSFDHYAFIDCARARQDACEFFGTLLQKEARATAPGIYNLAEMIRANHVTRDQYAEVCGEKRILFEELRHAKDHLFAQTYSNTDDALHFVHLARSLPKAYSPLRNHLEEGRREGCDFYWYTCHFVIEYSGKLGGVIDELSFYEANRADGAIILAALDFLAMQEAVATKGSGNASLLGTDLPVAQYFLERLRKLGFPTSIDVLKFVLNGAGAAKRALELFRRVYELDFLDEEQRSKLMGTQGN